MRTQGFPEGEAAAEGVAVGVLVPENEYLPVPVDQRFELVQRLGP